MLTKRAANLEAFNPLAKRVNLSLVGTRSTDGDTPTIHVGFYHWLRCQDGRALRTDVDLSNRVKYAVSGTCDRQVNLAALLEEGSAFWILPDCDVAMCKPFRLDCPAYVLRLRTAWHVALAQIPTSKTCFICSKVEHDLKMLRTCPLCLLTAHTHCCNALAEKVDAGSPCASVLVAVLGTSREKADLVKKKSREKTI